MKAVQRMLGHARASMTLDVYADLFDEDLDSVADDLLRPGCGLAGLATSSWLTPKYVPSS